MWAYMPFTTLDEVAGTSNIPAFELPLYQGTDLKSYHRAGKPFYFAPAY